jgi:hypothetical protein
VGIDEELLKLGPLCAAPAFLVAVLLIDGVAQARSKSAQFAELVLVGLAFVFGRNAGVNGGRYSSLLRLKYT